jgi:hypothetical protein
LIIVSLFPFSVEEEDLSQIRCLVSSVLRDSGDRALKIFSSPFGFGVWVERLVEEGRMAVRMEWEGKLAR